MGNCACIESNLLKKNEYQINIKSLRNIPSKYFYDIKGSRIKESLSPLGATTLISNHKHLNILNNITNDLTNSYIHSSGIINQDLPKNSIIQNSDITNKEIQNSYNNNNYKNNDLIKVNNHQNYKNNINHDLYKNSFYLKKDKYSSGKIEKIQKDEISPTIDSKNLSEINFNFKDKSTPSKSLSNTDLRKPILSKLYQHNKKK